MCGISGVVALGRPAEVGLVEEMSARLAHRGPDGADVFAGDGCALGFRRLAILDLSSAGMQPFASADGRYRLVHNGEIYNYRELRPELESRGHAFRTGTDTEVLLAAFVEWGPAAVSRFNGMWAFAIWDTQERRLFASRDRFGIKPFYYALAGDRLLFASEPQALLAGVPARANGAAVRDYLAQGYLDHTEETFFGGILRLPPAHSLTYDERGLRLDRYWQLERRDPPAGDAAAQVRELFLDSVRLRLRSDVPVGTCLSGGLDSSAIVCAVDLLLRTEAENAAQVGDRQRTFTAFFEDPEKDERPFARAVVEQTRVEPHWITFDDRELVERIPEIVAAQGEPFGSTSQSTHWFVLREAKSSGLTVMLDGQGGDEIFAGYHGYFAAYYADLLAAGRIRLLRDELRAYGDLYGVGRARLAELVVRRFVPDRVRWFARGRARGGLPLVHPDLRGGFTPERDGSPFPDRLRRLQQLILGTRGLPELLRYEDRNSMAHSLEARVPFLDYRLVELLFSLPGSMLLENGRTKAILRRALGDLLPPAVRERTDKLGFVAPEERFLRGALGDLAADVFASQSFRERGWADPAAAQRRLAQHRSGEITAGFELWRALNLELWARSYLDAAG
ncbi:MAG TPA: asparagine synthase (glutamine-hydrolyzing) [Gaiellaceae bacterium]|nr:asparagine synthase (glutamine-hydrolyzing) [Gaiellaceae bacterium]